MRGGNVAVPNAAFTELMERAEWQESVTLVDITEILDTEELSLAAETSWSNGSE